MVASQFETESSKPTEGRRERMSSIPARSVAREPVDILSHAVNAFA